MLQHQLLRLHTAWHFKVLSLAPGLFGSGNKMRKPYSAFLMAPDTVVPPQVDAERVIHRYISVCAECNIILTILLQNLYKTSAKFVDILKEKYLIKTYYD